MAKGAYIGKNQTIPIYTESITALNTRALLEQYFTFEGVNNESTSFFLNDSTGIFTSNNTNIPDSTAQMTLRPKQDLTDLYFDWKVSSEFEYDTFAAGMFDMNTFDFPIWVGASGEDSGTYGPITCHPDCTIMFSYKKDGSTDIGNDNGIVYNIRFQTKTQTGTTTESRATPIHSIYVGVNNVARPIIKAYVGVGGKARPFWSYTASFYGNLDNLPSYIGDAQGVTFNNNAIFFGGSSHASESTISSTAQTDIYAYNPSLTRSVVGIIGSAASYSRDAAATNKYIISATSVSGGSVYFDIINTDFTTSTITHPNNNAHSGVGVGSLGNYLFAAGGIRHVSSTSRYYSQMVCGWNENLTCVLYDTSGLQYVTDIPNLSNNDTYVLIGGGTNDFASEDNDSPYVVSYDTNLTKRTAAQLSHARRSMGTTTFNNLAIFAGGESTEPKEPVDEYYTAMNNNVDAYSNTLTHTSYSMQYARGFCAPVGLSHNLVIRGGHSYYEDDTIGKTAEILDENFTSTLLDNISTYALTNQGYAKTGRFAIYFGGYRHVSIGSNTNSVYAVNTVEAFKE